MFWWEKSTPIAGHRKNTSSVMHRMIFVRPGRSPSDGQFIVHFCLSPYNRSFTMDFALERSFVPYAPVSHRIHSAGSKTAKTSATRRGKDESKIFLRRRRVSATTYYIIWNNYEIWRPSLTSPST